MKAHGTLVLVWLAAGVFAIGGSILVGSLGKPGLFIGAILGGGLGAVLAVAAATKLGWLAATERRSAAIGAVVGFLIAAPIADSAPARSSAMTTPLPAASPSALITTG